MEIIPHVAGDKVFRYPKFQAEGFAAKFAFPFAKELCIGNGLDIGYSKPEWKFPDATGVEPTIDGRYHAMNLPKNPRDPHGQWDFIFSSHCLEHVEKSWAQVLLYWKENIRPGGVLFLYLPGPSQMYWKNWPNKKHVHNFNISDFELFFQQTGFKQWFVSGEDLNSSFYAVAQV